MILQAQKNEITEHLIYQKLSEYEKNHKNKKILKRISDDELKHYKFWQTYTKTDIAPSRIKVFFYVLITRMFGLTFGIRLMEKGEEMSQVNYEKISKEIPEVKKIIKDEEQHEQSLIGMINEEKLEYIGSMVLGLNDALVELTGALAGFTLALGDTRLIALTGGIMGIAASLSMAASGYLSAKADGKKNPLKSSVYTGVAYVITVMILIAPYLFLKSSGTALGVTLTSVVLIILIFTFYTSVAKNIPFKQRFLEMVGISMGVSAFTFGVGYTVRVLLGIEI